MLLTLSTTHQPAGDLGYLLHKHPDRVQTFSLSFGKAIVYYPRATDRDCTACLLLDIDPVSMMRRRNKQHPSLLSQYVNDRPYVASSFMSVAIAQVFGTAMSGRCRQRPELVETALPLTATLDVLPVHGDPDMVQRVFEPLGYQVQTIRHPLDEQFPDWGESQYYSVSLSGTVCLSALLTHLYVLIPVFDNSKHYFVGDDELDKLLAKGHSWLPEHPEKETITRRYLRHRSELFRQALAQLMQSDEEPDAEGTADTEEQLKHNISLNEQRLGSVLAALRSCGARRVLDLGCGEGKLLKLLMEDSQFEQVTGVDVSIRSLEHANRRLRTDRLSDRQAERLTLLHGSLMYRDRRFCGYEAAAVVEVIEHLDPPRLAAFERVLFEFARPQTVVLTTPNQEYNVMWESLPAGNFRHADHRFEWTRSQFQDWACHVAEDHDYSVRFLPVGPEDERLGSPTQMAVFEQQVVQQTR